MTEIEARRAISAAWKTCRKAEYTPAPWKPTEYPVAAAPAHRETPPRPVAAVIEKTPREALPHIAAAIIRLGCANALEEALAMLETLDYESQGIVLITVVSAAFGRDHHCHHPLVHAAQQEARSGASNDERRQFAVELIKQRFRQR
jgi:hypothetical protein